MWVGGCTYVGVPGNRSLRLMWEIILHVSPTLYDDVGSLNQTQSSLIDWPCCPACFGSPSTFRAGITGRQPHLPDISGPHACVASALSVKSPSQPMNVFVMFKSSIYQERTICKKAGRGVGCACCWSTCLECMRPWFSQLNQHYQVITTVLFFSDSQSTPKLCTVCLSLNSLFSPLVVSLIHVSIANYYNLWSSVISQSVCLSVCLSSVCLGF